MAEPKGAYQASDDEARYGFRWGPLVVQRYATFPGDRRVLGLRTDTGRELHVYVSPTGRSVRVFEGGKELTTNGEERS